MSAARIDFETERGVTFPASVTFAFSTAGYTPAIVLYSGTLERPGSEVYRLTVGNGRLAAISGGWAITLSAADAALIAAGEWVYDMTLTGADVKRPLAGYWRSVRTGANP